MPKPNRSRRSRREIDAIVRRFRASGQSQRSFARAHAISPNTLASWLHRERRERENSPTLALVPVETPVPVTAEPFEIVISDTRIRIPRDVTAEEWRALRQAWTE